MSSGDKSISIVVVSICVVLCIWIAFSYWCEYNVLTSAMKNGYIQRKTFNMDKRERIMNNIKVGDKVIISVNLRLCNGIVERVHGDYYRVDVGDRCELVHKSNLTKTFSSARVRNIP